MSNQQYTIKDPRTGKLLTVSRDVHSALTAAKSMASKQQKSLSQKFKEVNKEVSQINFEGKARNLEISLKFEEDGTINMDSLNFNTKFNTDIKAVLDNFMWCLNQALSAKNDKVKDRISEETIALKAA